MTIQEAIAKINASDQTLEGMRRNWQILKKFVLPQIKTLALPPNDNKTYAMRNGEWVEINQGPQ